jgi:hypothetical protein
MYRNSPYQKYRVSHATGSFVLPFTTCTLYSYSCVFGLHLELHEPNILDGLVERVQRFLNSLWVHIHSFVHPEFLTYSKGTSASSICNIQHKNYLNFLMKNPISNNLWLVLEIPTSSRYSKREHPRSSKMENAKYAKNEALNVRHEHAIDTIAHLNSTTISLPLGTVRQAKLEKPILGIHFPRTPTWARWSQSCLFQVDSLS